jgi:large subunit ribosomal protein L10
MNQQALEAKKAAVAEVSDGLKNYASLTVVSYQGLTVAEVQELRRTLEKDNATFGVYKNTLVRRALKDCDQPDLGEILNGPNAFVFSKDISKGPKDLFKFARFHQKLVIKGGLVEGQVCDAAKVKEVSKLPDKNGMISMFLSCLNAPLSQFAATIQAIADSKSGDAPAPSAN